MSEYTLKQASADYERIGKALLYLEEHYKEKPPLASVAREACLSEFHFQRVFTRWAGISPKRFMQYLTLSRVKRSLTESGDIIDASLDAGLSSQGRLHDLFVTVDAVTPSQYRELGKGLVIKYGFQPTPFGTCLVAFSDRGITNIFFQGNRTGSELLDALREEWPLSRLQRDNVTAKQLAEQVFEHHAGRRELRLFVKGTNLQVKVWEGLLRIPPGTLVSYGQLATMVDRSNAVRAVASAVGANPIAFLIPCHRVIRGMGVIGNYRWGSVRKKAMIAWEAGRERGGNGA